jgi:hypothetical protein
MTESLPLDPRLAVDPGVEFTPVGGLGYGRPGLDSREQSGDDGYCDANPWKGGRSMHGIAYRLRPSA